MARQFWKGDELLYRPLTHVVLAVENQAFGYRYRAWNQINLLLHLAVVFVLFELLWALQPSPFAGAFALVFSVLTADFELIVWNHLPGYLLGYGLMLVSLRVAGRLAREDGVPRKSGLLGYALATLGAMGCHEIALVGAVLTAAYVEGSRWRRGAPRSKITRLALFTPLGVYVVFYGAHVLSSQRWLWVFPGVPNSDPFPLRLLQSLGAWTLRALNPWYAKFSLQAWERFQWSDGFDKNELLLSFSILAVLMGVLLFCLRPGITRDQLARSGPFAALLAGILLAYSAMNNFGRSYASTVTYYLYFFSLIGAVLVYSLVDFRKLGRTARSTALALLLVFGAANAWRTFGVSRELLTLNAPVIDYFDTLEKFVQEHRHEPEFGFAVRAPESVDPIYNIWKGYPDHPPDGIAPLSALLYRRYFDVTLFTKGPDPLRHKYLIGWNPPSSEFRK